MLAFLRYDLHKLKSPLLIIFGIHLLGSLFLIASAQDRSYEQTVLVLTIMLMLEYPIGWISVEKVQNTWYSGKNRFLKCIPVSLKKRIYASILLNSIVTLFISMVFVMTAFLGLPVLYETGLLWENVIQVIVSLHLIFLTFMSANLWLDLIPLPKRFEKNRKSFNALLGGLLVLFQSFIVNKFLSLQTYLIIMVILCLLLHIVLIRLAKHSEWL